jgi:1-acyl-sn-glycerol-3-phosphate acyltransferase
MLHRLAKATYEYTALFLGLSWLALICIAWTPLALLMLAVLPPARRQRAGRRAITAAFRLYLTLLGWLDWVRVDLTVLDALRDEPPLVIAPNHPSLLDAVLVLSRLSRVGCILRADRLGHPLLGPGARLAGYIPNDQRLTMIKRAIAELRAGHHLLLFPEGTRTTRRPVNSFISSPALIAQKAGVPIQTVFIETASPFLGKHRPWFRQPALPIVFRVRLGRRFPPPREVRACTAALESYFTTELNTASALSADQSQP